MNQSELKIRKKNIFKIIILITGKNLAALLL